MIRKGDVVNSSEVRSVVMNYIKEKNLQIKTEPKYLKPDELIYKIFVKNKQIEKITFEDLFSTIFTKLSPMHEIKKVYKDRKEREPGILRKGKFQSVEFKLESRGGNKKVTSIHNLGEFEVDFIALQAKIRKEIGCSVSLIESNEASATGQSVICVQGNQIIPISELLNCNNFILF